MRLETEKDRGIEYLIRARMEDGYTTWHKFPSFSAVDYVVTCDCPTHRGDAIKFVEVKSRKDSMETLTSRHPDGILLKRRKYEDMLQIERTFTMSAEVLFAFESGRGSLASVRPPLISGVEDVYTGRRDRNLATDEEPVVLIPWTALTVVLPRMDLPE
jgi:hypothetical protein